MYDVIIVGCGVAGSTLASNLNPDANVLVLEKDKKVFLKDSGIVSSRFKEQYRHKPLFKHKIREIVAKSPSDNTFSLHSEKPFAFILDRMKFSKFLRENARKNAKLRYENVIEIKRFPHFVYVKTNKNEYRTKMIVGADGAYSIVRRSLFKRSPSLVRGIMARSRNDINAGKKIVVYMNKYYSPDFFSWTIPQNNEYGIITSIRPKENFLYFKKSLGLPDGDIYSYLIPLGVVKSFSERAILLGDSCGHNKPVSGGGIVFSILSAKYAASVINDSVIQNDFSSEFLYEYERLWSNDIEREIKKQITLRKIYRRMSNKDIDKLFRKFGPHIDKINDFDYDKISLIKNKLPKIELIKFFIKNIRVFF